MGSAMPHLLFPCCTSYLLWCGCGVRGEEQSRFQVHHLLWFLLQTPSAALTPETGVVVCQGMSLLSQTLWDVWFLGWRKPTIWLLHKPVVGTWESLILQEWSVWCRFLPLLLMMIDDFTLWCLSTGAGGFKRCWIQGAGLFFPCEALLPSLCPPAKAASSAHHVDIPRISADDHRAHFPL